MARDDSRIAQKVRNAERQDILEQKLGISQTMNRLRDERALRATERFEREKLKDEQRQNREKLRH